MTFLTLTERSKVTFDSCNGFLGVGFLSVVNGSETSRTHINKDMWTFCEKMTLDLDLTLNERSPAKFVSTREFL